MEKGIRKRKHSRATWKSDDESDTGHEKQTAKHISKDRPTASNGELQEARKILKQGFPTVPAKFIKEQLAEHKSLHPAYRAVEEAKELDAVEKCNKKEKAVRTKKKQDAEEDEIMECECCFDDAVLREMVHCEGDVLHFFCTDCVKGHVRARLDYEKYEIRCMAGCNSGFSRSAKLKCLDKETFARLERGQQQIELHEANLPGLELCPFCDFAAICPPFAQYKEFRCEHPECRTLSCRRCRAKSHPSKSCEQNKKDCAIKARHVVEEEMTNALIRTCPKCRVAILKADGCNKIVCSRCGASICDVCGMDISKDGYSHFGPNKCTQYDHGANDKVARENRRVQKAEGAAKAKIRAKNSKISEADLRINTPLDAVKARKGQLGGHTTHEINIFPGEDLGRLTVKLRRAGAHLKENGGLLLTVQVPPNRI